MCDATYVTITSPYQGTKKPKKRQDKARYQYKACQHKVRCTVFCYLKSFPHAIDQMIPTEIDHEIFEKIEFFAVNERRPIPRLNQLVFLNDLK